jgi:hypothetical protein
MLYTPVKQKFHFHVTKQQANLFLNQRFLHPPMAFISHFIYGAESTKALQRHRKVYIEPGSLALGRWSLALSL